MSNLINLKIIKDNGDVENIDLFNDESIFVNSSVQNIKDISKIYTDYTKPFTIPASKNNNRIFKHYYNVDVFNGFDARKTVKAVIEVNLNEFRKGKLTLLECVIEHGEIVQYKVNFVGDLLNLFDRFEEDTLNDLDMSGLNHDFTISEVLWRIEHDGDIIYPLISRERNWQWNSRDASENLRVDDIRYYNSGNGDIKGINISELRPSIKLIKLIEVIEQKYGITISDDFFNRTSHFNDLFIYCNREIEAEDVTFNYRDLLFGNQTNIDWVLYPNSLFDFAIGSSSNIYRVKISYTITPNITGIKYNLIINGSNPIEVDGVAYNGTFEATTTYGTARSGGFTVQAVTTEGNIELDFTASATREYILDGLGTVAGGTTNYGPTLNQAEFTTISISNYSVDGNNRAGVLPDMTIKDFLEGLVKMFNLVIIPVDDTTYKFQQLDDWYADGDIIDVTDYIDTTSHVIKRPTLPSSIEFKYQPSSTVSGKKHADEFGEGYGDLEYEPNYDGSTDLTIQLPFENIFGEMLQDVDKNELSTIHVTKLIDIDSNSTSSSVETAPIIHYNAGFAYTSARPVALTDGASVQKITKYNIAKNTNNYYNAWIDKSINFGTEKDTYKFGIGFGDFYEPLVNPSSPSGQKYSLFSDYWEDYITDLYDYRRREFNYSSILPPYLLNTIKLNDKLVINNRRFIINDFKSNLLTGEVKLNLLNDIYSNTDTPDIHARIVASSPRLTCHEPIVVFNGIQSTGIGALTYAWTTSDGTYTGATDEVTASVTSDGTYTLTVTDSEARVDNTTYTVTDSRITPSVTISTPNGTVVSESNRTLDLVSSITSGYTYSWDGPPTYIVSGKGTDTLTVSGTGTYTLTVTQNNTGCQATDSVAITGFASPRAEIKQEKILLQSTSGTTIESSGATDIISSEGINVSGETTFNDDVTINNLNVQSLNSIVFSGVTDKYVTSGTSGVYNVQTVDSSNNLTGNYGFAGGYNNGVTGNTSAVFGASNSIGGGSSFAAGSENNVQANFSTAFGRYNYVGSSNTFVTGENNDIIKPYSSIICGTGHTLNAENSTIVSGVDITGTTDNTTYGDNAQFNQYKLNALNTAPASSGDTGTLGEIRIDANYIYVCTATDTWVRSPLSTW